MCECEITPEIVSFCYHDHIQSLQGAQYKYRLAVVGVLGLDGERGRGRGRRRGESACERERVSGIR